MTDSDDIKYVYRIFMCLLIEKYKNIYIYMEFFVNAECSSNKRAIYKYIFFLLVCIFDGRE